MAMTKTEAAKLTNDMLLRGVIDTVVEESTLFQLLPFMNVNGTALTYNRENTLPDVAFYDVGSTWTEDTPDFTQVTANLKILGGDADVDNFLQQSYANPNDLEVEVIRKKAKAVAHKFLDTFYNGDDTVDTNSFDGLTTMLSGTGQESSLGTNGGNLTLDAMDTAIDLIKPGRPDAILMSKRSRRKLSGLRRTSGTLLETTVDAFGQHVVMYDGIPVIVDDFISDTQTQGAATTCSSIYMVKFGTEGIMGLENGELQVVEVGDLETKDATRWRIKWYCGLAQFSTLGLARIVGILP